MPSVAWRMPNRPLTPTGHLHPAICGPPPPRGSDPWGRCTNNWPTLRQTRRPVRPIPTTAKIPLFFHPLYGWKNRGEAPGDGFRPNRGWLVSGQDAGPAGAGQAPPTHKPPSGQRATPLRYQARVPGSQGWCPGNCKASLQPRGSRVSPRTTLPSRSPTPAEAEGPGKTFGPGPWRRAGHGSEPGGTGPGLGDAHPRMRSPVGTHACAPPGQLRVLFRLKLPHPTPRRQSWTQLLQISKVWAKLCEKGL